MRDQTTTLGGGFANPATEAAFAFRAALDAMARPGRIQEIRGATPPAPLSPAAGALILTLCDPETALHIAPDCDNASLRDWIGFHTGAPITDAEAADFAVGSWASLHPLERYRIGTPEYPDRSVTLIVECADLAETGHRLTGPGIETEARLTLPETAAFQQNRMRFPMGFDCFFTCGDRLAALPRSTRIAEAG